MNVDALVEAARVALVNLNAFFEGGADELDYVDRARDELHAVLNQPR